jgi:hypothetical protein
MDRNQALFLLRRSQSDIWAQASLRRLVANRLPPAALDRMSDEQVREAVADMIASGELVVVWTHDHGVVSEGKGLAGAPKRAAAAPPPSRPASQVSSPPPPTDPDVFPPNINPAAQAAANQQAAAQGAPFCLQ